MKPNCIVFLVVLESVLLQAGGAENATQSSVKNALANGDFGESPVGQPPAGWKPAYPTGTALVASDGKDTFLRLANTQPANAGVSQLVDVPGKVTMITVLGRMRGKPQNEKVDKQAAVQVALRYLDAAGANISAAIVASENSPNWHTFKREFKLPPGCAKIEVVVRSIFAVGTFDFDEVRVEFR